MTVKTSDMSRDFAAALRAAHASDVRALSRMSRHELAALEQYEGPEHIMGGPVTKDELINAIANRRYPIARQNEAIHVLTHTGGGWSACEWCQCQETRHADIELGARRLATVIEQCSGQPGHDGDHTWPTR